MKPLRSAPRAHTRSASTTAAHGALLALSAATACGCTEPPRDDATPAPTTAPAAAGAPSPNGAKPPPPRAATAPEPENPLEREVWSWAREVAGAYEPAGDYHAGEVGPGRTVDVPVLLQTGRCARILAASDGAIQDLTLSLFDPNGSLAREEAAPGPRASLGVDHSICPPATQMFRLEVGARDGAGAFRVRVYQSPY